jgi:hypothetical protein
MAFFRSQLNLENSSSSEIIILHQRIQEEKLYTSFVFGGKDAKSQETKFLIGRFFSHIKFLNSRNGYEFRITGLPSAYPQTKKQPNTFDILIN